MQKEVGMASHTLRAPTHPSPRWTLRRITTIGMVALMGLLVLIQFVPYGRDHTNPQVVAEPAWDSLETRALFMRACGDCHSNETVWPWYSNVAPVSWLVTRDVVEGRAELNISAWGLQKNEADDAAESVQEGEMPLWFYTPLHPEAKLTAAERQQLINGLTATFGGEGGASDAGTDSDD
jgi:mono/diheme cytochrome c family protein